MSKNKKPSEIHQKTLEAIGETLEYKNLFPEARKLGPRKIIFNCGTANSGKSFAAYELLKTANHGLYCAPLRLLALEGGEQLEKRGIKCNIITGDYEHYVESATHSSCTIEMSFSSKIRNNETPFDIAVIDEIQMISPNIGLSRSHHWTQCLVGIDAKIIIICGSEDALPIIKRIAEYCGDTLEINNFERKVPLEIIKKPISLESIKQNDCIVAFSRREILALKDYFTSKNISCSCVFGNLPPEIKIDQAKKFNSGENTVLLATDCLGLGLNYEISRIFFQDHFKFSGNSDGVQPLESHLVKQIAGRAGRFLKFKTGYVGSFNTKTSKYISQKLNEPYHPINGPVFFGPDKNTILKLRELGHSWFKCFSIWRTLIKTNTPNLFLPIELSEELLLILEILDKNDISNEIAFNLTMAPISDLNISYFVDICNAFTTGRFIELPRICLDTLLDAETSYNKLMLFTWISLRFADYCTNDDKDKIQDINININQTIDNFLTDKSIKNHVCSCCGIPLQVSHKHKMCDKCYFTQQYTDDFEDD